MWMILYFQFLIYIIIYLSFRKIFLFIVIFFLPVQSCAYSLVPINCDSQYLTIQDFISVNLYFIEFITLYLSFILEGIEFN